MQVESASGRLGGAHVGDAQVVDELDLRALSGAMWRKKRLIITLTLAAAAVAFVAVNMMTPRYRSEARVLIETRDNIFVRPEADKTSDRSTTVDQEAVTSQVQLILSRDLGREVIKKLKLGERPEFDPVLSGRSFLRVVLGILGIAKDPMTQTPEERVLKSYFDRLSAFQVEKSRVIAIEFDSEDPELAARAANAVADGYLVLQQSHKQDQTRAAGQWLSGEILSLRGKVADAEAKVEEYRSKSNLFIGTNNTTLSNQQLGDSNSQLATARAQKADAEAKARMIRDALRNGTAIEFADITNSELLRRLSEQRVTLRAQLAEQSSTLLDQHPRIKELRAQINDLERQMRAEGDRLVRSLENDAKLAGSRVEGLSASLDQLKRQAASTNEQDVQLRALERDAKSQRDLLESYLAKFREATARDNIGAASADARVISTATVTNTPAWPKKLPTVLLSGLAMFVLSAGFVLTGALLGGLPGASAAGRPVEPVVGPAGEPLFAKAPAAAANLPSGAAVVDHGPAERARTETVEPATPPAPMATPVEAPKAADAVPLETIEVLARGLGTAGEAARRIAVLGVRRHIGTTIAAITLARSLAKQGRVVLVDLALGSPNLAAIAADPRAPGIAELTHESASFGQIITRDRFSSIHLIMAGRPIDDAQEILSSPRLAITLEALARSYDYVVVDAGALPELPAERFAGLAPRAVLVADENDGPETAAASQQLQEAGFAKVSVLAISPRAPAVDTTGARVAA
jgi:succinoglycan biosynthesis transport protein ExoP